LVLDRLMNPLNHRLESNTNGFRSTIPE
jgi:hypothetical protein